MLLVPREAGALTFPGQGLLCYPLNAAIESKLDGEKHHSHIQILVKNIAPGLCELDPHLSRGDQLAWAVEANVRWSMHQLLQTPEGRQAAREGRKKLVGAVFEINSGRVRFFDQPLNSSSRS